MPVLSISNATVEEGYNNFLSFEVTLSEPALDTVSFFYRALEGTGTSDDLNYGFDYSDRTYGTVVMAPGETSATIRIGVTSDTLDERDESIILQLTNLSENAEFDGGEAALRATGVIFDDDGAGSNLSLLVSDPAIKEGDQGTKEAVFEVRLSQPATSAFSVNYSTKDISAAAGSDYVARFGTLDFAVGEQVKLVSVQVLGDTTAEQTESFALVLDSPSSPSVGTDGLVGEATIRDDDSGAGPVVSVSNAVAVEDHNEYLSFEVTLSEAALDTVTLSYRALEGTANSDDLNYGYDYNGRTYGTIEFAPGVTSKIIYIQVEGDGADERDESVVLQLTNLSENASFAGGEDVLRATGVILDNDGTGPNLSVLVSDPVLVEGDSGAKEAVFEVRLSRPATEAFSVSYETRDITATGGTDYVMRNGLLNFAAGEEVKTVSVSVLGDALAEATESFALVVGQPSTGTVSVDGLGGVATIRDDDTGTGPVVTVHDAVAVEDHNEYLSFEVTLSEASLQPVSMNYRALAGTGNSDDLNWGLDYNDRTSGTIEFAPGVTSKIIYIQVEGDNVDERDESIYLRLTDLSETARFAGGESRIQATGIIHDNDGAGSNLALLVSDPALIEGDSGSKYAVFDIRLSSALSDPLTVNYQTKDITAVAGSDYFARIGSVNFAPGELVKSVRVEVIGDATAELNESFALIVEAPDTLSLDANGLVGEATIMDDDTTPGPVISVANAFALEGHNEYLAFEVSLSEASTSEVTVDYRALEGTGEGSDLNYGFDYSGRTVGSITIAPGQTTRRIYIQTEGDSDDERDETIMMELSNAVGASFADGAASVQAVGFILDNDGLGPNRAVSVAPAITREKGGDVAEYEIPILMSQAASVALSFDVAAVDQTAVLGQDYRLLDSSITFLPGETSTAVRVQILGDALDENTETFALSVTLQEGMPFVGSVPAGIVTILNGPRIPTPGDDVLEGTSGPDVIDLLAGDDFYNGLGSDDLVRGGSGNDTIIGGEGSDTLYGEAGNDLLIGGQSTNAVSTPGGQVYRIYRATLDRAPDTGGFEGWVDRLESGTNSIVEIATGFVASREFQNVYGSLDNTGFVNLLYNNVLGRAADSAGLAGWLQQLDDGTSRQQVVIGFSESAEFKAGTATEANTYTNALSGRAQSEFLDDVFRLYRATLDRDPDQRGLESWSTLLSEGQAYPSIAGGFTNSTEFRNTYGALDNNGFVDLLYQNVLDRAADAGGLEAWLEQMSNGLSREGVVQGFAQSREFINKTAAPFTAYMKAVEGDVFDGGPGNDRMAGGIGADTFVFDASEKGSNVILQLDDWDTLQFDSFGYSSAQDVLANTTFSAAEAQFADQGVVIKFAGADLETMQNVDYLFG
ncbi:Calx-beta domain-containing protein [Pseudosulfitobacter sp. DSM 107133]|uniref:Calx-beta domain-containing protein n=1 Tax=Pseudosulfitobacter sp. DSM 107133 TaxID=2883100 RepID=UPI000DF30418|nr:Calx-beta domain-containing protein [Pseudosulfitobacter sp. DSM 107133]UOA26161.1 Bifunctional hemolysin/adenylate cyclase [Pseudosulfitobacter sp. DSM 107133]